MGTKKVAKKKKAEKTSLVSGKKRQNNIILIVEDDRVLLRALYILFHKHNYTIATATNGDMAIKMANRLKPGIVLLDLLLPRIDGFEVLRNIKSNPETKDTPVVVLSNLGDSESMDRSKILGAEDYFIKSNINLSDLAAKIEAIKEKSQK